MNAAIFNESLTFGERDDLIFAECRKHGWEACGCGLAGFVLSREVGNRLIMRSFESIGGILRFLERTENDSDLLR